MSRINGELRQSSSTSNMIWSCAELIHFFSRNFTLRPGMVIITGTPAGTAWSADKELGGRDVHQPGLVPATRYCLPGDVVECEVEGIGILRNPVSQAGAAASRVAAE
jgi:2-keto-4-pentenoate hydratase/2-oxohepta-3-ene-1,7-dioic acid hydratase in catechol pathway